MDFLKRESPYFKNGVPSDFDHMDKAFMMEHFNELNTQGVDRDEALAWLLKVKRLVISLNSKAMWQSDCLQGHLDIGGFLSQRRKSEVCGQQLS